MSDPILSDVEANSLAARLLGESLGTISAVQPESAALVGLDDLVARLDRLATGDVDLPPAPRERRPAAEKLVVFELTDVLLAFPLTAVGEVVAVPQVTPLPRTPDWICGVVNLRGDIVPVVDLNRVWNLGPSPDPRIARLIVVHSQDQSTRLGLVVNRVIGLRPLTSFVPATDESAATGLHACFTGFTDQSGLPVAVCDVDRLLTAIRFDSVTNT